ncbi:hypothetical protein O6B34_02575 [Campylobacter ureolyticus]|nr:hypothetical protein [Campylobacter ureolyticus]MCZ6104965.1 hypothetical protein [Campylobacter ureolyticus]MDU5325359.1 hypothetical protein [Campylobacter ureolyticus]
MKKVILGILALVFGSVLSANNSNIDTLRQNVIVATLIVALKRLFYI